MAAPVGSVWLSEEQRYRTDEEQTEGQMPENVWLIGYAATVRQHQHCSQPRRSQPPLLHMPGRPL